MRLSLHRHRPDRRAHSHDAGGWLPLLPIDLRPGLVGQFEHQVTMNAWLLEAASLTARLQQYGVTKVRRIRQKRVVPNRDERWFLGSSNRHRANLTVMVREVVLEVNGVPWVFAHTLANAPAVRLLRRAGRNALAVVLFTDPQVIAGPLQYRRTRAGHPLYSAAQKWRDGSPDRQSTSLMARRALFSRGPARLLVTEVFLPPVANAPPATPT